MQNFSSNLWKSDFPLRISHFIFLIIIIIADSYVAGAAREAGSAAELAAARKEDKYSSIDRRYLFEPIAIETLGVYSRSARQLLSDLGRKISQGSGEVREASFLFQRCSVLVQRFNAVLLYNSFTVYCTN